MNGICLEYATHILRHRDERFSLSMSLVSSINFQTHESYVSSHFHGTYFSSLRVQWFFLIRLVVVSVILSAPELEQ